MKNYFFVNPIAGQGKGIKELIEEIKAVSKELNRDSEIYITESVGDGRVKAREIAESLGGESARFFACGGDGTFNEIVNGAIGFDGISVGCVPIGTGNDMVRNFPDAGDFLDIKAQLLGSDEAVDLMKYSGIIDGKYRESYCANMFNIGFDCNVVELAGRLKKKPFIAGSAAYLLAVLGMFLQKKGICLKLTENGETLVDGEVLLCAIANGSYCGGGMYTSPQSNIRDGVFDLNIVNDVSRMEFLKLFPKYQKGTHLGAPGIEKIISVKKCRSLQLEPKGCSEFFLCVDGEIFLSEKISVEIVPKAIQFIVPSFTSI